MLSQFLCRAVARWNEPLPIAAGDARRGRSWGWVGAVPASSGSIGEVGSGMARKKRGYRATGPEGRGCGVHIPAVCLRCIFGVLAEVRDGDLYGASEGRRKLPVGCLQGRKARLHSRKKIVNLLLIRKPTEKWPTRSPAGHSPCLHRYYFSADCSPPVRNNPRSRSTRCANVTT